jgi:hypothetical protein
MRVKTKWTSAEVEKKSMTATSASMTRVYSEPDSYSQDLKIHFVASTMAATLPST